VSIQELKALFDRDVPGVNADISPHDGMHVPDKEDGTPHYFRVGQSGLRCIKLAMLATGKESFDNILDFPSGYGRVLRTLRSAFPTARITACDILKDAVDYCAQHFQAVPVCSKPGFDGLDLSGGYDLIWCGSLFFSLKARDWSKLLALFQSLLGPDGILVFTYLGRMAAQRLRDRLADYGLAADDIPGLLADYDACGFAQRDYPLETMRSAQVPRDYGISVASPVWVCRLLERFADLRLVMLAEHLHDNHEDVVVCARGPLMRHAVAQEGHLDVVNDDGISGWAWDRTRPNEPLQVEILDGSQTVAVVTADLLRDDLAQAGKGAGNHGFRHPIPDSLKDGRTHIVRVRIADSGVVLEDAPKSYIHQDSAAKTVTAPEGSAPEARSQHVPQPG